MSWGWTFSETNTSSGGEPFVTTKKKKKTVGRQEGKRGATEGLGKKKPSLVGEGVWEKIPKEGGGSHGVCSYCKKKNTRGEGTKGMKGTFNDERPPEFSKKTAKRRQEERTWSSEVRRGV